MEIARKKLLDMYRKLLLCRRFDEKLLELNASGVFSGWLHLGAGQEAMPVAVGNILHKNDWLKVTHRGFHCALAKGVPVGIVLADLMGKEFPGETYQGSTFAPEFGLLGTSHSLGEDVPLYVGVALSSKLLKTGRVVVCFFGDGTANRGPVHEAMNLAAIWKLPIVFVCENNQYAISMHVGRSFAVKDIAERARGYGMPGSVVDGNDVFASYEEAYNAIERARSGGGPSFVEAKTYRLRGHWEGDKETYRSKEEVEEWRKKDPLPRYRDTLLGIKVLTEELVLKYEQEVAAEIDEAVKQVHSLPRPSLEKLTKLALE